MLTVTRIVRIEWGHCDPAGIVYFPRYFEGHDPARPGGIRAKVLPQELFERFRHA